VLHDVYQHSPTGHDILPLSVQQQYILEQAPSTNVKLSISLSELLDVDQRDLQEYLLEQAASALHVPPPVLLDLSHQRHHLRKRPRLNTGVAMSSPYSDEPILQGAPEKSSPSSQTSQGDDDGPTSFSLFADDGFASGWTGARLADCFASMMCPPCSTYESPSGVPVASKPLSMVHATNGIVGYQALPTTTSYDYNGSKAALVDSAAPLQPPQSGPYSPIPVNSQHTDMFACDTPELAAQYMASYPPLQPDRVMGFQPSTSREGMVYPSSTMGVSLPEYTRASIGLGIQGPAHLVGAPDRLAPVPGAFGAEVASPSVPGPVAPVGFAAPYGYAASYEVKDEPDSLDAQSRPRNLDMVYCHQRAPPARRGPFKDLEKREKTARTRKIGSCIRCRMQRIRVSSFLSLGLKHRTPTC
jgi:hypothetical protein